ncbi:hypothetical protein ACRCUN_06215 [Mycobacterium sp. LTG2003]
MTEHLYDKASEKAALANGILAGVDATGLKPADQIAYASAQALVSIAYTQMLIANSTHLLNGGLDTLGKVTNQQVETVNRIAEHVEATR